MTDYRITCSTKDGPDPDYRIDGLGGPDPKGSGRWYGTIDQVLQSMDAGHTFWVMVDGKRVAAIPMKHPRSGRRYVTTEADGFPPNNLLNLPDCPK